MKAFNRTLFAVFILLPCLILGYQNCSELSSQDAELAAGGLSSENNGPVAAPVFLNDLSLLGYSKPSDCSADSISPIKLFNSETNICTEANDSCEAYYLIKNDYLEDQNGSCNDVSHPDDTSFQESLKTSNAASAGFKTKPGQICTMQFAEMINFKKRLCAAAANGCEISYFKSQGYVVDQFGICR